MANSEALMRRRICNILEPLHAVPVENSVYPGTPDVSLVSGWLELKQADKWPARETTPLRIPTFTTQQRLFLSERHRLGGRAWLLLRVQGDWLLFHGHVAATHLGTSTKAELLASCIAFWHHRLDERGLIHCLRKEHLPAAL